MAIDFESFVNSKKATSTAIDNIEYAFSSDRITREGFKYILPIKFAMESVVKYWKYWEKNKYLGSCVKVSDRQFPRVHSLLKTAANTLNIPVPTMFITGNPQLNAYTFGTNEDSFVVIHSSLVDHFTDEELLDVIGHECGHIQNSHVVAMTTLYFLTNLTSFFIEWITEPAVIALKAWSRRAEVTCDRAGLLVCRDPAVSKIVNVKLALGSQKLYKDINMEAYLEQYEEGKTGFGRIYEWWSSHPNLPKRVKSLEVFTDTQLYRKHMGLSGGISMEECDRLVKQIITVA